MGLGGATTTGRRFVVFEYQCHFLTYGTSVLNVYHGKLFVSPNGIHYCDPISIGVVSICQQTFRYLD